MASCAEGGTGAEPRGVTSPLAWLLPVPPDPPTVVLRDDVGAIGWQVLLREGALEHVWGDLAVPADQPPSPVERARALASQVPARAVVGRSAAAWVHTGLIPPTTLDLLVEPGHRRLAPDPSRRTRECPLPRTDVDDLGGVRVTSVQRTGLDLARWGAPTDPTLLIELDALLDLGFDPHKALDALTHLTGQRGLRTAREVLARLAAQ
ncbi:hypothetical protein GALL_524470 [mine drainage metagenome]|uniref:AbiEi antitoxin C-terminal domain-containing protein n=1 Tax=mine drainage metagenome TaxID=410659 RepID=A0A1J5PDU4_9ZZZZ